MRALSFRRLIEVLALSVRCEDEMTGAPRSYRNSLNCEQ
jgi:hypothetical protein